MNSLRPHDQPAIQSPSSDEPIDEGGLHAPSELTGWRKAWWWFDFLVLVKLARLRFIAILALIGVVITQWDLIAAHYDRWTRPTNKSAATDTEFFCPMHPAVVRDHDREKCPICFMPLARRKKGLGDHRPLPAGVTSRVQLSPYRIVLAGVQTSMVDYQPLTKEVIAVGAIEFNERNERTVSARVAARIERLFVSETGQLVSAGDPLAQLYSPDLNVSVQNLLEAQKNQNLEFERNAKVRLSRLGIDDDQINEILQSKQADTRLTVRSPQGGHVIKKYIREGQYVQEGMPLYDIADLSTVWIQAQLYEDEIAFLPVDASHRLIDDRSLELTVRTGAFPDEVFVGRLAFVFPHIDQMTRTVTIRCEVDNPDHKLRPGGTASVTLRIAPKRVAALARAAAESDQAASRLNAGEALAIPASAVIDTGKQKIVYRQSKPDEFEGVLVELGPPLAAPDGRPFYPVLKGLAQGEQVVTAGSFLVDAETRLNPAAGSIYFGGGGGSSSSTAAVVRPSTPNAVTETIAAALAELSAEERAQASRQRFCPVLPENELGSMGKPVKITTGGESFFVCCEGCQADAIAGGAEMVRRAAALAIGDRPTTENPR